MTGSKSLSQDLPLVSVLMDIRRAYDVKLYYPALLISLTVPEICMALALKKSEFVREKHYVEFINKYAVDLKISGLDCYRLRGGLVHRANMTGHDKFLWSHVVFTIPESQAIVHGIGVTSPDGRSAAILDLAAFCNTIIQAALNWYEAHKDDSRVRENMLELIRFCPNGISPVLGAPVVASGRP